MFIKKMLKDRGYTNIVSHKDSIEFSILDNKKAVLLHYNDISISTIGELKTRSEPYDKIIIVKNGKVTPAANSALKDFSVIKDLEIFDKAELEYSVIDHEDCSKYTLLPADEVEKLLKLYRSTKQHLPKIVSTDPIRKYYGWKKGDVVKEETDDEIYYRIVV
jgi:DNA-directed RNA polymerase subunit H (RpoH/RPB5)